MDSSADCDHTKPTGVHGDFFPRYEWILDCVLQDHKVLSEDLNHKLIADDFICGYRTGL